MAMRMHEHAFCRVVTLKFFLFRSSATGTACASLAGGARIAGEQLAQLVAEHRKAARLENDDGQVCIQPRAEHLEHALERASPASSMP